MSRQEFQGLLDRISTLSPDQMLRLREELNSGIARSAAASRSELTREEMAEQELQRRLVDAGVLSEVKPPPRLLPPRERFAPIPIEGEPLSETIIRERR